MCSPVSLDEASGASVDLHKRGAAGFHKQVSLFSACYHATLSLSASKSREKPIPPACLHLISDQSLQTCTAPLSLVEAAHIMSCSTTYLSSKHARTAGGALVNSFAKTKHTTHCSYKNASVKLNNTTAFMWLVPHPDIKLAIFQ